jgi:hypothetical protein
MVRYLQNTHASNINEFDFVARKVTLFSYVQIECFYLIKVLVEIVSYFFCAAEIKMFAFVLLMLNEIFEQLLHFLDS